MVTDQETEKVQEPDSMVVLGPPPSPVNEPLRPARKSKRHAVVSRTLVGDYQCDKGMLNRVRQQQLSSCSGGGVTDFEAKFARLVEKLKPHRYVNIHLILYLDCLQHT